MKKKEIVIVLSILLCISGYSQTSVTSNSGNSGDFLGWDASTTFDLQIKHENNRNIRFLTNNILRGGVRNNGAVLLGTTMILSGAALSVQKTNGDPNTNFAVRGILQAPQDISPVYSGYFEARGNVTNRNVGVAGFSLDPVGSLNIGISSRVCNGNEGNTTAIAIYGKICSSCIGDCWALWLDGKSFSSLGSWQGSDASLKTNIQDLTNGMALVQQISPKSYNFIQDSNLPNLPTGLQYGVIAQELESVVP